MYTGFAIPRLRVRQNAAGTLDARPAPDVAPWEASEDWWKEHRLPLVTPLQQ
jgi:hypothetical protein